jgi:tRNA1Val (adenine37-N6)-methyltransferase
MKVTTDSCLFGAWAANQMKNEKVKISKVLDIGCGTGLLSLMIAQKNAVQIDAVEIDADAAKQADENINASPWKDRVRVFHEDILQFQPSKKYDCIICNPPFYENELSSAVEKKNMAHHSSHLTVAQVLDTIKSHLEPGGRFFLMYPYKRQEEMNELMRRKQLYTIRAVCLHQSIKHTPFRSIVMGTNKVEDSAETETIAVWNEHQQYTEGFTELLKDYYLYL